MERTVATLLLLLLAVTGTAVAEPQFLFNVLRGNNGGRSSGLLGNIINSTAGILLKPLNLLGGGGHGGETSGPESGHGGGIKPPNSDASTYKPTSQGVHEQTGGGSSGHGEDGPGHGSNNGIGAQTSGTTQNSVDSAIDEIFGNRGGGGTTAGSTASSSRGPVSDPAAGGTSTVGKGQEESTTSAVDLAIQQIFGGGTHGGDTGKPTSTDTPNNAGSSNPSSEDNEKDEHKQSTASPFNLGIQDVFGHVSRESEASSTKSTNDTGPGSDGKDGTASPVDSAILDVFGKGR